MKPKQITTSNIELRKLDDGINLKIFFDSLNGAKNFAMGLVIIEPGKKTSKHTRDVEEIIYVIKGEVLVITNEVEYTLKEGDSILIPAGIEHYHENRSPNVIEQIYIFTPQGPEKPLRELQIMSK